MLTVEEMEDWLEQAAAWPPERETSGKTRVCVCSIHQLWAGNGHDEGCIERETLPSAHETLSSEAEAALRSGKMLVRNEDGIGWTTIPESNWLRDSVSDEELLEESGL